MKMKVVLAMSLILWLSSLSSADLLFKMTADKTDLLPGEQVTITLHAFAESPQATGANGLNGWNLDVLVDTGSAVEVVVGSVVFLAPSPSLFTGYNSINSPNGEIEYLNLVTMFNQGSNTSVDGYSAIAAFDIKAIGLEGQSVTYTLGRDLGGATEFDGYLADGTRLQGVFDIANSQNVFTIVPEPSSLLILSGLTAIGFFRRKRAV